MFNYFVLSFLRPFLTKIQFKSILQCKWLGITMQMIRPNDPRCKKVKITDINIQTLGIKKARCFVNHIKKVMLGTCKRCKCWLSVKRNSEMHNMFALVFQKCWNCWWMHTFWSHFSFYISHDFDVWLLTYLTHCFIWMVFKINSLNELRKTVNTFKVKRAKAK